MYVEPNVSYTSFCVDMPQLQSAQLSCNRIELPSGPTLSLSVCECSAIVAASKGGQIPRFNRQRFGETRTCCRTEGSTQSKSSSSCCCCLSFSLRRWPESCRPPTRSSSSWPGYFLASFPEFPGSP